MEARATSPLQTEAATLEEVLTAREQARCSFVHLTTYASARACIHLPAFYVCTPLQRAEDKTVNQPDRIPALMKLTIFSGEVLNKYYKTNFSNKCIVNVPEAYEREREK